MPKNIDQQDAAKWAFSIREFCKLHSISRAKFYLLCKEGKSPRLMRVGRRRLISRESAEQWRKEMEFMDVHMNGVKNFIESPAIGKSCSKPELKRRLK